MAGTMEGIRQTQKKYGTRAMAVAIFAALFFILIGYKPLGKGLVLGALFSVVNFVLMGETLSTRLGRSKGGVFFWGLFSIFGRYALLAIPLIIAIKYEQYHLVTTIVGIFSIQLVIFLDHFIRASKRAKQI